MDPDEEDNVRGRIYSPETSDGTPDWTSKIVGAFVLLCLVAAVWCYFRGDRSVWPWN